MNKPVKTIDLPDGQKIDIFYDQDADDPRTWDNLGHFAMAHRRYSFGDSNHSSVSHLEACKPKDCISLPVYMYDHSGITISTKPFSCPWDSGQIGEIWVDKQKVRDEYRVRAVTSNIRKRVEGILRGEIETLDQYLRGDVYYYVVKDKDGDTVDSCHGFYDIDECIAQAQAAAQAQPA